MASIAFSTVARAEPQPLDLPSGTGWSHEPTGIAAPPQLGDFVLGRATSFIAGGQNTGLQYDDAATGDIFSLYVYRAGTANISMLADLTLEVMTANKAYDKLDLGQAHFSFFGDDSIGVNSGVRISLPANGRFVSTGAVLYAIDGWVVKMRLSSTALSPAALDAKLDEMARLVTHKPAKNPAAAAYRIEPCEDTLKTSKAKRADTDQTALFVVATQASIPLGEDEDAEADGAEESVGEQAHLCREAALPEFHFVYRVEGEGDGYFLIFGDSGTVAHVGTNALASVFSDNSAYWPSIGNGLMTMVFRPYRKLPNYDQLMQTMDEGPVARVWRKEDGGVSINLAQ